VLSEVYWQKTKEDKGKNKRTKRLGDKKFRKEKTNGNKK
jgi:hypothetical protein